jgi:hypothetical protein
LEESIRNEDLSIFDRSDVHWRPAIIYVTDRAEYFGDFVLVACLFESGDVLFRVYKICIAELNLAGDTKVL